MASLCLTFVAITVGGQTINTVAGNGTAGYSGDGAAATAAKINTPTGACVDNVGNIYIADFSNNRVRKVTIATGIITTVAGTGAAGHTGDGGLATAATLNNPEVVALGPDGISLYICEQTSNVIRLVDPHGIIHTVAGNGTAGFSGDGAAATAAQLNNPQGVSVDQYGDIYIADQSNNRIREVSAFTGNISTIAGTGAAGYGGDGAAATLAKLNQPAAVCVDALDNVYIADYLNHRIRMITASTGIISTIAGNGTGGFMGDGAAATAAEINQPYGISVDQNYNIIISDYANNRIRLVDGTTGFISTLAGNGTAGFGGDGGSPTAAKLNGPLQGVYQMWASNVFIADWNNNRIREITNSPLPVELVAFNALPDNIGKVNLTWTTASETNNDYFTVERSADATAFESITQVKGAGNSSSILQYETEDENPLKGYSYYRLKQTDYDGKTTYSKVVPVDYTGVFSFNIYPNPSMVNQPPSIALHSDADKEVLVIVQDVSGVELYSKVQVLRKDEDNISILDGTSKFPPGLYIITASSDNTIYKKKFVIR